MEIGRLVVCMMAAGILTAGSLSASTGDDFNFSGCVRQYNGCSAATGAPIKNAQVTIDDNLSCIIDGAGKRRIISDFVYSTVTDSTGRYSFNHVDPDSFTCGTTVQMVTVEANGFFPQSRDITPGGLSVLDFDLFEASGSDSFVNVTVTVFAIEDTTWSCMEGVGCFPHLDTNPLYDCRIELPDRYLFWRNTQVLDTTDAEGKATFPLSVVPFVDYRIVAQSLHDTGCRAETTITILTCRTDVQIIIPAKTTTRIVRNRSTASGCAPTLMCLRTPSGFRVAAALQHPLPEGEHRAISLALYDLTGKKVGSYGRHNGITAGGDGRTLFFDVAGLSPGTYIVKMKAATRIVSQKILLQR